MFIVEQRYIKHLTFTFYKGWTFFPMSMHLSCVRILLTQILNILMYVGLLWVSERLSTTWWFVVVHHRHRRWKHHCRPRGMHVFGSFPLPAQFIMLPIAPYLSVLKLMFTTNLKSSICLSPLKLSSQRRRLWVDLHKDKEPSLYTRPLELFTINEIATFPPEGREGC